MLAFDCLVGMRDWFVYYASFLGLAGCGLICGVFACLDLVLVL